MKDRTVKLDITPLLRFEREWLKQHGTATFQGEIGKMWQQIGAVYLSFTRKRFIKFSKGGGSWPPLKRQRSKDRKAAKRAWKRGKIPRMAAILRDTGTLLNALTIGQPGNKFNRVSYGIQVGFGGPSRHGKGKATIRDIAVFHNEGRGHLPKREILVEPEQQTTNRIISIMRAAINGLGKECEHAG
jgi:hypothetical protein